MSLSEGDSNRAQPDTLQSLILEYMPARVVHVAAHLGISDLLADGPKTVAALAQATNTSAGPLLRLLRALTSLDLLEDLGCDGFALTALGSQLRSNVPGSLRNFALMFGGERAWRSWGELLHCVKTGESGTRRVAYTEWGHSNIWPQIPIRPSSSMEPWRKTPGGSPRRWSRLTISLSSARSLM
jgi:hypothetical protein